MTNQPSSRDLELLSAYLDGQLSQTDVTRLQSRLKTDPELRSVYEGLHQTRALLRQLPTRRAPRNFRLTPQMVGIKPSRPRTFSFFRLASVLASVLLFLGYAANLTAVSSPMAAATGLPYGMGGGNAPEVESAVAEPTMLAPVGTAPAETAVPKIAPSATEELYATQQDSFALTGTPEETMSMAAPAADVSPLAVEDTMRMANANTTPPLPVPPLWLFGLLGLAVVSGASAFIAEQRWRKAKLTAKDVLLLALALGVVVLLAAGIYWMSAP